MFGSTCKGGAGKLKGSGQIRKRVLEGLHSGRLLQIGLHGPSQPVRDAEHIREARREIKKKVLKRHWVMKSSLHSPQL